MKGKKNLESLSPEEFEEAYIKYACDEVSHNTMTRGEFAKQLETNEEFAKRFIPDYQDNNEDLN